MFSFRDSFLGVEVAFTDVSLDIEDAADVTEAFGGPVARMEQVHGSDVAVVSAAHGTPVADALVTTEPGLTLLVRVADCVPVVLADPSSGVVGVAHAGRKGMASGVVANTVAAMRDLGARDIAGWVGPHICGGCYEVPEQMRAEVATTVPEAWGETTWGTPSLDLGRGVARQLADAGVRFVAVGRCTREDASLHSYRRDGEAAGRFAGLVRLAG